MHLVIDRQTIETDWRRQIPQHLMDMDWLHYEQARALELSQSMSRELKALCTKASARQVHDTRVALRKWSSVWSVMKEDGWKSKKFKRHAGRKIKLLQKLLGELRDWDVTIELGRQVGCSAPLIAEWTAKRRQLHRNVKLRLQDANVEQMMLWLSKYLDRHKARLENRLGNSARSLSPAYDHLDCYVAHHENEVRKLEPLARSPDQLHKLRLAIKRWRYLLTEYFSLTNLELVRAQQHLGKIHDYDRLKTLIAGKGQRKSEQIIMSERAKLKRRFNRLRRKLPYGLRPSLSSFKLEP